MRGLTETPSTGIGVICLFSCIVAHQLQNTETRMGWQGSSCCESRQLKILLLPGQTAGICENLHRKCVALATGRVNTCAERGTYIFSVLYGNLSTQFGMNATNVDGLADKRHKHRTKPTGTVAQELRLQIGECTSLAEDCVNTIGSTIREHVK